MEVQSLNEANMVDIENGDELPPISVGKDGLPTDFPEEGGVGKDGNPISPDEIDQVTMHSSDEEIEGKSEEDKGEVKQVSFLATIGNLLNSMLGAGILSVPSCFVDTGLWGTIIITVIVAVLSYFATYMVIAVQGRTKGEGFSELAFRSLGKIGNVILDVLILLFLTTALLAYIIIGGDMILSWFKLGGVEVVTKFWIRAAIVCVYGLCIPIALTIPRNIAFLRYFSAATVTFILFYCVVMIYKGSDYIIHKSVNSACVNFKFDFTALNSISIASLTFALPCVCLPTFKIYDPDVSKRNKVAITAIFLCTTIVIVPSIFGYFIFGNKIDGNVLNSFPDDEVLIIITRGVFFFVVSFAYPMVAQSTMGSWSSIIYKVDGASNLSNGRRALVLVLTDGIPLVMAMFLSEAKPVLSIGGAIGGCIANYTFPALMFLMTSGKPYTHWLNILTILFAIFGVVVGILSTYQAVIDAIASFSS